jgi:hypothetical protein
MMKLAGGDFSFCLRRAKLRRQWKLPFAIA